MQYKSFQNTVGKGEIARNEQFLLFPQCFFPLLENYLPFSFFIKLRIVVCKLCQFGSLKFVVWERVKMSNTDYAGRGYSKFQNLFPNLFWHLLLILIFPNNCRAWTIFKGSRFSKLNDPSLHQWLYRYPETGRYVRVIRHFKNYNLRLQESLHSHVLRTRSAFLQTKHVQNVRCLPFPKQALVFTCL